MVLLIIIPFLNGYFIGNIPYFQTNTDFCPSSIIYPLVIEHSHGIDGPFIDGLAIKNADIFHGYVK